MAAMTANTAPIDDLTHRTVASFPDTDPTSIDASSEDRSTGRDDAIHLLAQPVCSTRDQPPVSAVSATRVPLVEECHERRRDCSFQNDIRHRDHVVRHRDQDIRHRDHVVRHRDQDIRHRDHVVRHRIARLSSTVACDIRATTRSEASLRPPQPRTPQRGEQRVGGRASAASPRISCEALRKADNGRAGAGMPT